MKLSSSVLASIMAVTLLLATDSTMAFAPAFVTSASTSSSSSLSLSSTLRLYSTMADAGVPPTKTAEGDVAASNNSQQDEEVTIPTSLPSAVGFDYVPLATCLATGQWAEADQVCLVFEDIVRQAFHIRPLYSFVSIHLSHAPYIFFS
jgi:hypothetical protein